ncbi:MAG: LytTR family DNA-binding domain-containing protein [Polyangiales bacterium]
MPPDVTLRVLVLEDEWVARNLLVEMIEATGLASVVGAIGTFDDAVTFVSAAPSSIDVVFVDIKLVGSAHDGLALIQRFVAQPGAPAFVLATALREHAIDAFELGVVDYVLKPFDQRRVTKCLEKLAKSAEPAPGPSRPARIIARNKRNLVFLTLPEIWAVEASGGLTLVHSDRGTFDMDLSLDTVATSFGRDFLRVHRNWLVSEDHVLELERASGESALLLGNRSSDAGSLRVPIAKDRAATLRARLMHEGVGIRRR